MKHVLRAVVLATALAAILSGGTAAHAQTYPSRPISLVIPYTVGGSVDYVGRVFAGEFAQKLGQPVIVQNQPGGGGTVGSQFVAKSTADGYTLLITNPAPVTPAAGLPYDPVRAFVLIAPVTAPSDKFPIFSVFAPAGTPPATIARLASAVKDSLATTSLQGQFAKAGLQVAAAGQDGRAAVSQKPEQARPALSTNTQQNQEDALAAELKAANAGDALAMYKLGARYELGKGVAQSYDQAVAWYRKAADVGDADAMAKVGYFYQEGRSVAQNDGVALSWYRKAADAGRADAMYRIGYFYEEGRSVAKSDDVALSWYRKAADAGSAGAMAKVGYYYRQGLGVAQNDGVALSWYRKAADAGNADAMSNIGFAYAMGRGVPQNTAESIAWFQKAAAKGQPYAIENLKRMETQLAASSRAGSGGSSSSAEGPVIVRVEGGGIKFPYVEIQNTQEWSVSGSYYLINCVNTSHWCENNGAKIPMPFAISPRGLSGEDWVLPDDDCKPYSFQPRVDWVLVKTVNGQHVKVEGRTLGPSFGPYTHPPQSPEKCARPAAKQAVAAPAVRAVPAQSPTPTAAPKAPAASASATSSASVCNGEVQMITAMKQIPEICRQNRQENWTAADTGDANIETLCSMAQQPGDDITGGRIPPNEVQNMSRCFCAIVGTDSKCWTYYDRPGHRPYD